MTEQEKKAQGNGPEIVAKLRGVATIYADKSLDFRPDGEVEKPLYNETLATTKFGTLKQTDKSLIMRVGIDAKAENCKITLLRKVMELLAKVPGDQSDAPAMPDFTELVGETLHSKVFLQKEEVLIQTAIRFDEPNPKIADLLAHASAEQLKYIKQYLDLSTVYQSEVAALCLLLANCQAQHEKDVKLLNSKPRKSKKK